MKLNRRFDRSAVHSSVLAAATALLSCIAVADDMKAGVPSANASPVYTRAEVRSFEEESDGKLYVRLKLIPRSKIPFSTQTFLVADRSLLAGIKEGASVRFTAKHLAGENTLTSIQLAEPCRRFEKCE